MIFPIRLLNQDVEFLFVVDETIDCCESELFVREFVDNVFAVRSSNICFISLVISGNNSQNIGS
jgi:hypothetical protein